MNNYLDSNTRVRMIVSITLVQSSSSNPMHWLNFNPRQSSEPFIPTAHEPHPRPHPPVAKDHRRHHEATFVPFEFHVDACIVIHRSSFSKRTAGGCFRVSPSDPSGSLSCKSHPPPLIIPNPFLPQPSPHPCRPTTLLLMNSLRESSVWDQK